MPYGIIFMSEVLPTLILTAGGVAAFWIGTSTFLRLKRSGPQNDLVRISESLELLNDSMDDVREAIHSQMGEMRELSGRIEFTERMLTKARDEDRV